MLFTQTLVDDAKLQVQEALIFLCDLRPSEAAQLKFEVIGDPQKLPGSTTIQVNLKVEIDSDILSLATVATVYMLEYSDRNLPDGVILTRYITSQAEDLLRYYPIYSRYANESTIVPDFRDMLRSLVRLE